MARDHARVLVAIWGEADWKALPAASQRAYMLALSQRDLSYAGVAAYSPKRWATLAADTNVAAIRRAISVLVERRFVIVDEDTDELLVRTFVKHDRVLRYPNVAVAMARAYRQIASRELRRVFLEEIHNLASDPATKDLPGWTKPEVAALLTEALR